MLRFGIICTALLLILTRALAQPVAFTSSNLPIIAIHTNGDSILNEPKIMADMGIVFNGENAINHLTDPFNHYYGKIGIEIRGQSSQTFPMKSYSLELRDAAGNNVSQSLFGMPKESDWVLYAPYTDKTLMRNFLAYTMAREMGRWAARCRFVEVVINGDYKGVYVFMEKIKRDAGRVNIAKLTTADVTGDAVTGGYIFSLDKQPNGWYSSYLAPYAQNGALPRFSYVYPKPDEILPAQMAYIKSYVDAFENALAAPDFQDPVRGVRKYADLSSFIDYFLVNEVSRNVDGYRLSSYFHKDRDSKGGRIVAGPVWDYDLAFRNADYCDGSKVYGWALQFNYICPGDGAGLIPFWWDRLLQQDTAFQAELRCRWKYLRQTSVNINRFTRIIDSVANLLSEAQARHFQRWPILGKYVWPNPQPIAGSYPQEIEYLKDWLNARLEWINSNIPNKGDCYDFPPDYKQSLLVKVIPNPVTTVAYAEVISKYAQPVSLQVTDMLGRTLGSQQIVLRYGINRIPLPADRWGSGVYFIRFTTTNGETLSTRIVK